MHIILAILGPAVTILILLNRLAQAGIDFRGLNPLLWRRRRKWKKTIEGNPIFRIDQPLEMAALLATACVKSDGDMSSEEKAHLIALFQSEFSMSEQEAAQLSISSSFLLGRGEEVNKSLEKVIKPSMEYFTESQAESTRNLLKAIVEADTANSSVKLEFVSKVDRIFNAQFSTPSSKW